MFAALFLLGASALAAAPPASGAASDTECIYQTGLFAPCGEFGPPQRIRGTWYVGFEESGFVVNASSARLTRRFDEIGSWPEMQGHLLINADEALGRAGTKYSLCTRAIAVEFIGREAFVPDKHRPRLTIFAVDKLLSARLIGRVKTLGSSIDKRCEKQDRINSKKAGAG